MYRVTSKQEQVIIDHKATKIFMRPTTMPVLLCYYLASITLMTITARAAPTYLAHLCPNTTTFSPNTTLHSNLLNLLSLLSSNATKDYAFHNTTFGVNNPGSTVYGLFLCRGDVAPDVCHDCVSAAATQVLRRCPVETDSVIWFDECMLRYSNKSFFSTAEVGHAVCMGNTANISEQNRFMPLLVDTMNAVAKEAANGGAAKKFATKEAQFSNFQNLYTLAQCTPDLSVEDCSRCLKIAIGYLPHCCNGKVGGRVLAPSCNVRYEVYKFFHAAELNPVEERPKGNGRISTSKIAIAVPIGISLLLFFLFGWLITRRPRKKHGSVAEENVESSMEFLQFDLDTIKLATNNFCDDNKLGEGGFGEVYKGSLANGQDIAVKRLSSSSGQGAKEFKNEVVLVAKLHHRNLVRLLGFCMDGEEKILIYEFVINKSLDHLLFDPDKNQRLSWPRRYKIIEGIARGLLYLHEDSRLKIIHRDLKASNILLDKDFNSKISDFGMARIFDIDQTQANTNRIVGTFGYMSPEYAMHGQFSVKLDVYSFGILVLEIITGKKNSSFRDSGYAEDLINYAWKKWTDRTPLDLLDMNLRDSYSRDEVMRCIHMGLLCVQEHPAQRPTMQTVVLMLDTQSVSVAMPERPPSFLHSKTQPSFPTKGLETDISTNISKSIPLSVDQSSITRVLPR